MFGKKLIKFILGSDPPREKLVIRLEDLSQMWLKYNENVLPIAPPKIENTSPPLPGTDSGEPGEGFYVECDTDKKVEEAKSPAPIKPHAVPVKTATNLFYEECVAPYEEIIKTAGIKDELNSILEYLDKYGDCSSVVTDRDDEEGMDLEVFADILRKVTLKEHSFNVARIALKKLPQYYQDYENLIPKVLLTALCHDLGKIPELRTNRTYAKGDHPIISVSKMRSFFEGKEIPWMGKGEGSVEDVIKNHHRKTSDQFSALLKEADARARELEIESANKEMKFRQWEEWFDLGEFLNRIRIEINVSQANRWNAFSFGSIVYMTPDFLCNTVREMVRDRKVLDLNIMAPSKKEVVLKKIGEELRKADILVDGVKEGFYGSIYSLRLQQGARKMMLVPLKIEVFGLPSELKTKEGFLQLIKDVTKA